MILEDIIYLKLRKGNNYPLSFKSNSTYIIKEKCYIKNKTKKPIVKTNNVDVLGFPDRDLYSADSYLNKSQLGVISQVHNGNENKKLYITHSGNRI